MEEIERVATAIFQKSIASSLRNENNSRVNLDIFLGSKHASRLHFPVQESLEFINCLCMVVVKCR
jgi:hypothetical protein